MKFLGTFYSRYRAVFILTLFFICCIHSSISLSATLTILTDEPSGLKAKELSQALQTTPPFSRMKNLIVKIEKRPSIECKKLGEETDSKSNDSAASDQSSNVKDIPQSCLQKESQEQTEASLKRLVNCKNSESLSIIKAETNSDFMVYLRNDPNHGGSGGDVPTVNTGSPLFTGLHELLHRMGFADEYSYYTACEADLFCDFIPSYASRQNLKGKTTYGAYVTNSYNVTAFEDKPPYSSDQQARSLHSRQIPWFGKIKPTTLITSGNQLGTPQGGVVGLFQAKTCELSQKKIKTWKPGKELTIMESIYTNYIPESYWEVIAEALGTSIESKPFREESVVIYEQGESGELKVRNLSIPMTSASSADAIKAANPKAAIPKASIPDAKGVR